MTTSTMKLPASYAVIDAEEMTYLDGGASSAYQSFLDVGKVFNYIARIFRCKLYHQQRQRHLPVLCLAEQPADQLWQVKG